MFGVLTEMWVTWQHSFAKNSLRSAIQSSGFTLNKRAVRGGDSNLTDDAAS